ncbi:hypothetical protein OROGR_021006 [Orobanche gracilis]
MDSMLSNLRKYYSSLPLNIIKRIYRARLERLRVLMRNGIPEDIQWLIEAQVRLSGEFSNSFKYMSGTGKSSFAKKRRAKRLGGCYKCVRWTCDTRCKFVGFVSRNREDEITYIKDGLSKESMDHDIHQILDAHPSGYVHREIMALWIQFKDERKRYSHEKLVSKDSVCNPLDPEADATPEELAEYRKWKKSDEMARCYVLASLTNVLQHQHQTMGTAAEMMKNLTEMFGHQNRAARQNAMRVLMTTQMSEGTPVRNHVLKMMSHLNELSILGATIDAESQVDIILGSLPRSFEQFRLNYNMNLRTYTLAELLTELQSTEGLFRQGYHQVFAVTGAGSSKPKWGKKKKQVGQKQVPTFKAKGKVPQLKVPQAEANKKPKAKCFNCGLKGHFKSDCPKRGVSHALVVKTCLTACSISSWIVDSGSTVLEYG